MVISNSRLGILRNLSVQPMRWTDLKLAHFGPARNQSRAVTSYNNLLLRMIDSNQIQKLGGMYHITEAGRRLVSTMQTVGNVKSTAQERTEKACQHLLTDSYGFCTSCNKHV